MGDADITLRHIIRRHPEALVQAFAPEGRVEILGWLDTQVTTRERRLDKALGLRVDGERRALEVEFEYELDPKRMGLRVYEYQAMFTLGLAAEAPDEPVPPIESLVIVLSGRKKAWPANGEHRTSWTEREFAGARFRIDAVYQRTVEELRGRGSVFWLVFTPLACDATVGAIARIIGELRERVADVEELADLYAALLVMADVNPWGYNLRQEIVAMLETQGRDLIEVSQTLREAFERGIAKGIEKGRQEGIEKGIEKGRQEGIEKGIEKMLRRLFMRRLGRALSDGEQQALSVRASTQDPEAVEDRALTLEGEALAAWLLDPSAK